VQLAQQLLQLTESRLQNGVATRLDVAAASADLATARAHLSPLVQQRKVLLNALAMLLGLAPRQLDERLAQGTQPSVPASIPVGIPSELLRHRPDILEADAKLRACVADTGAAKADFYPRISLTGNLGYQAFNWASTDTWNSRTYSVGPTFYLPIFDGDRLMRTLALSEARQRDAAIAYRETVLKAWHEVDDALSAWHNEQDSHVQLTLVTQQSHDELDVAQRNYQQGAGDQLAVLKAQRTLLFAQSTLAQSTTASSLVAVSLVRALGAGWQNTLTEPHAQSGVTP
jgi:NodT family efflux transporter outer membrane factor (OMF) lipoprotein